MDRTIILWIATRHFTSTKPDFILFGFLHQPFIGETIHYRDDPILMPVQANRFGPFFILILTREWIHRLYYNRFSITNEYCINNIWGFPKPVKTQAIGS